MACWLVTGVVFFSCCKRLSGASQEFADAYPMIVLEEQNLHLWYVTSSAKGITFFPSSVELSNLREFCFLQDFSLLGISINQLPRLLWKTPTLCHVALEELSSNRTGWPLVRNEGSFIPIITMYCIAPFPQSLLRASQITATAPEKRSFAPKTGWWFQIFFIFTPTWGRVPI